MKVEITKQVTEVETIDVELPYYYKHDLMSDHGDCIIYGRIDETTHLSINEDQLYDGTHKFELEKETHSSIKNSGLASYFAKKHASTEEEFKQAKMRCENYLAEF